MFVISRLTKFINLQIREERLAKLEKLLYPFPDDALDVFFWQRAVDNQPALGLLFRHIQVATSYPLVKGDFLSLKAVAPSFSGQSVIHGDIKKDDKVGLQSLRGDIVDSFDEVEIESAPVALVGDGGFGEAVADNHGSLFQGGANYLSDKMSAGGVEKQKLGLGVDFLLVLEPAPQAIAQGRTPGLVRQ